MEALGCEVKSAIDGRQAVNMAAEEEFMLVLMDLQMPGLDGFEATKQIRERESQWGPEARHVPIVAVTANTSPGTRETCLDHGMQDYMIKPLDKDSLKHLLAELRR